MRQLHLPEARTVAIGYDRQWVEMYGYTAEVGEGMMVHTRVPETQWTHDGKKRRTLFVGDLLGARELQYFALHPQEGAMASGRTHVRTPQGSPLVIVRPRGNNGIDLLKITRVGEHPVEVSVNYVNGKQETLLV